MNNAIDGLTDLGAALEILKHELQQAASFRDKNLSFEAQEKNRAEMRANARQAAAAKAAEVHQRFDRLARAASEAAMAHRPSFNQNDLAQVARTRDAWEMNILPQLQAGKDWSMIIPNISRDDALAIERFAPTYVKANAKMPHEAAETMGRIQAGVWSRHAQLADTDEGRAAILEADRTAGLAHASGAVRNSIEHARNVPDLTTASITLQNTILGKSA